MRTFSTRRRQRLSGHPPRGLSRSQLRPRLPQEIDSARPVPGNTPTLPAAIRGPSHQTRLTNHGEKQRRAGHRSYLAIARCPVPRRDCRPYRPRHFHCRLATMLTEDRTGRSHHHSTAVSACCRSNVFKRRPVRPFGADMTRRANSGSCCPPPVHPAWAPQRRSDRRDGAPGFFRTAPVP